MVSMLQNVVSSNPRISAEDVAAFEKLHGITLPGSYRKFLIEHNGGEPTPAIFPISGLVKNPDGEIQVFFGIRDSVPACDLDAILSDVETLIPVGVVPIAATGGGDYLVLDIRKMGAPVAFWDRRPFWGTDHWSEADLYRVAENFVALLRSLHAERGSGLITGW